MFPFNHLSKKENEQKVFFNKILKMPLIHLVLKYMKAVSLKIYGKVQGVFFRVHTKEKADELGLKGFVRNEPDGTVYTEAEGDANAIKTFVAWCHLGPKQANVTKVETHDSIIKGYTSFEIQR